MTRSDASPSPAEAALDAKHLVLLGRPGCHLCDEARDALSDLAKEIEGLQWTERDIEDDEELLQSYVERIPVILLNGRVIGELVPDRAALRATLLNTPAR